MSLSWSKVLRPGFVQQHYRRIVFALALVKTALIVFLVVYIWTYGLESSGTRLLGPRVTAEPALEGKYGEGTVVADKLVVRAAPGGTARGSDSVAVIVLGEEVRILGSLELDGAIWVEVGAQSGRGWVPASGVRYIRMLK
jgi:hypothetical protein